MEVLETTDYSKFKFLAGNRALDPKHVARLERLMLNSGNLTQNFPVVINHEGDIIDGQHRVKALKNLGWPVFYTVSEGLGLSAVRAINIGHKNWSWINYAESYAELGNKNYDRLLALYEEFKAPFYTLVQYVGSSSSNAGIYTSGGSGSKKALDFKVGDFKLSQENFLKAWKLLEQLEEAKEVAGISGRTFQSAMYYMMISPDYNHKRMLEKLEKYGAPHLAKARRVDDYLRGLEDTYNTYVREDEKVRLF